MPSGVQCGTEPSGREKRRNFLIWACNYVARKSLGTIDYTWLLWPKNPMLPSGRTFLKGKLYYDNRRGSIECVVRDMSASGARLTLA